MLWIADPEMDKDDPARTITRHQAFLPDPTAHHATQPWTGVRWCVSCFTSRRESMMDQEMSKSLGKLEFPLAPTKTRTGGQEGPRISRRLRL